MNLSHGLAGRAPLGPVIHQHRQFGLQHLFVEVQWMHSDELPLSAGLMDSRGRLQIFSLTPFHSKLTEAQKSVIERDFGMTKGARTIDVTPS